MQNIKFIQKTEHTIVHNMNLPSEMHITINWK